MENQLLRLPRAETGFEEDAEERDGTLGVVAVDGHLSFFPHPYATAPERPSGCVFSAAFRTQPLFLRLERCMVMQYPRVPEEQVIAGVT